MVRRRSSVRAHGCEVIQATNFGSWRLRPTARRLAPLRRSGLTLLIALALSAIGLLATLALTVLALSVLALRGPAALLARRQIGRRRLLVLADDYLGAVGQVGKAGRHHTIVER